MILNKQHNMAMINNRIKRELRFKIMCMKIVR